MTRDDLLALPATIDLPTAARALGIGRNQAYDLAALGEFPCKVLKLGKRYKVVTSDLLQMLGIESARPVGEHVPARHPARQAGTFRFACGLYSGSAAERLAAARYAHPLPPDVPLADGFAWELSTGEKGAAPGLVYWHVVSISEDDA